ncbi:MAG: FHA domain-containing protein [Desulfobulbaceae bacterium]|nr:FHA domain-containing protein [Desulfobulbaceae bacterium]
MATITVKFNNKVLFIHPLELNKPVTIGRLNDNDIVIDNVAVSGIHAQIVSDETGFIIKDLGSKNGIFIDGKPVKARRINNCDIIQLGKHELLFNDHGMTSQVDMSMMNKNATATFSPDLHTAVLDTRNQQELLRTHNRFSNRVPMISVKLKGKVIYKHLLKKESATIGRNPVSAIVIDNTAVSYDHAVVVRKNDDFYIQDLGSKNGTLVNDKSIKNHKLYNGDLITVGRHELLFEEEGTYTIHETCAPSVEDSNYISGTTVINVSSIQKPSLTFIKGGKGKVPLNQKIITFGKSKDSDILVKGLMVGDTAAIIAEESDGYYFSYQNGFAKPSVNGQTVKGTIKLKSSDVIELGSLKMRFRLMG